MIAHHWRELKLLNATNSDGIDPDVISLFSSHSVVSNTSAFEILVGVALMLQNVMCTWYLDIQESLHIVRYTISDYRRERERELLTKSSDIC